MSQLADRDQKYIWHPYTKVPLLELPIPIVSARGALLYAEDGSSYIDAISSWWTTLHGHSHPFIAERITKQFSQLDHVIFAGFTHPPAIELSERLVALLPGQMEKIFFSDNGSTAVEVAIKMALQYWHNQGVKKTRLLAFENAYHGDTFGAMSVSGRSAFTRSFESLLFDVDYLPVPVKGREEACLNKLEELIQQYPDQYAAFIFEPLVQGAAGMVMYEPGPLQQLIYKCRRNEILCIADEVMTGFGRTGKNFAMEYLNESADIVCLSKGLSGGVLPMGITACNKKIFSAFLTEDKYKTFFHGHSFTANPVSCSAALASLDLLETENCRMQIRNIETRHQLFLKSIENHPSVTAARVCGTILAIEFKNSNPSGYFNSLRDRLYQYFISKKILLRPLGNIVYILPPYCISEKELELVYNAIAGALEEIQG